MQLEESYFRNLIGKVLAEEMKLDEELATIGQSQEEKDPKKRAAKKIGDVAIAAAKTSAPWVKDLLKDKELATALAAKEAENRDGASSGTSSMASISMEENLEPIEADALDDLNAAMISKMIKGLPEDVVAAMFAEYQADLAAEQGQDLTQS